MADSNNSLSSRDVSSTISLYEPSHTGYTMENMSTQAVYELDPEDSISRPLSRGSVTSGVSMMATKDGVDGEKVKRIGIPQYSLNLLNSMAHNQYKKTHHLSSHPLPSTRKNTQDPASSTSVQVKNPTYLNTPNSPPMTLKEKMYLLNNDFNPEMEDNFNDHSDFGSISDSITDSIKGAQYGIKCTTRQKSQNNVQDSRLANFLQVSVDRSANGSDIDSNVSTIGDEASFSRNMQNLSPPIGVTEGESATE